MADPVGSNDHKASTEVIAAAVAVGTFLLTSLGKWVESRSKRREEERQRRQDTASVEDRLRKERDDYHKLWQDGTEEAVRLERASQERIRFLEAEIDRVTALLRAKSEERHDVEAWARALHAFANDAKDELDRIKHPFRPLPERHHLEL